MFTSQLNIVPDTATVITRKSLSFRIYSYIIQNVLIFTSQINIVSELATVVTHKSLSFRICSHMIQNVFLFTPECFVYIWISHCVWIRLWFDRCNNAHCDTFTPLLFFGTTAEICFCCGYCATWHGSLDWFEVEVMCWGRSNVLR